MGGGGGEQPLCHCQILASYDKKLREENDELCVRSKIIVHVYSKCVEELRLTCTHVRREVAMYGSTCATSACIAAETCQNIDILRGFVIIWLTQFAKGTT